jgi:hypothetical protein
MMLRVLGARGRVRVRRLAGVHSELGEVADLEEGQGRQQMVVVADEGGRCGKTS